MSKCEAIRERLVLHAERVLEHVEAEEVEQHLAECADCRAEAADIAVVRRWLEDPALFMPEVSSHQWKNLPDTVVELAGARSSQWRFAGGPSLRNWAVGIAAGLVLAIGLGYWTMRHEPVGKQQEVAEAPGNRAFLERIQAEYARGAAWQYLADCQALLLNLVRAGMYCEDDHYDLAVEVESARELLRRKKLLDTEMRAPEIASAKNLCDELENVLLSVSTSESCATPERLRQLEQYIQREQLLLRINLIQLELS